MDIKEIKKILAGVGVASLIAGGGIAVTASLASGSSG